MAIDQDQQHASKRTAPRDVRRKQLIAATMDSIAKRGFADTTLKHVTEGANLSHGVVNYHFDSKEALYDATLGYLAKEHYDLWTGNQENAEPDAASQLAAIVAADFDKRVCTEKKLAVWFAFWGQAKYRPNYVKIHNKYDQERSLEVERLCRELVGDGEYHHTDAKDIARTIISLIDGLWLSLMLYPSSGKREASHANCLATLELLFPDHFENAAAAIMGECRHKSGGGMRL